MVPGSYVVHRAGDSGCESACATVGAMGHFCEASDGSFTVTDVAFTPDGDLEVLDADFRVECIDTVMSGSIRYGAARDIVALDQDAESLLYPEVKVGETSDEQSISFTNIGTTTTTLGDADLVGGESADFAITSDHCSGATLAVGESCDVGVSFTPSDLGQRQAFLEIPDGTARGSRHVLVQGTGALTSPPKAGTMVVMGGARCTDTTVRQGPRHGRDRCGGHRSTRAQQSPGRRLSCPDRSTPPQHWTLTAGDGRKTVYARWRNLAGQTSAVVKDRILLDTTSPDASPPQCVDPGTGSGGRWPGPRPPRLDGIRRDVRDRALRRLRQAGTITMEAEWRLDDRGAHGSPPSRGTDLPVPRPRARQGRQRRPLGGEPDVPHRRQQGPSPHRTCGALMALDPEIRDANRGCH